MVVLVLVCVSMYICKLDIHICSSIHVSDRSVTLKILTSFTVIDLLPQIEDWLEIAQLLQCMDRYVQHCMSCLSYRMYLTYS